MDLRAAPDLNWSIGSSRTPVRNSASRKGDRRSFPHLVARATERGQSSVKSRSRSLRRWPSASEDVSPLKCAYPRKSSSAPWPHRTRGCLAHSKASPSPRRTGREASLAASSAVFSLLMKRSASERSTVRRVQGNPKRRAPRSAAIRSKLPSTPTVTNSISSQGRAPQATNEESRPPEYSTLTLVEPPTARLAASVHSRAMARALAEHPDVPSIGDPSESTLKSSPKPTRT